MLPNWSKPLGVLAQSIQLNDDFYTRSKSETIKALTHASALPRIEVIRER